MHRDLKPGNILITPEGRPVLVDFGIARSADLEPLTLTGTIVDTVDYTSPEQGGWRLRHGALGRLCARPGGLRGAQRAAPVSA